MTPVTPYLIAAAAGLIAGVAVRRAAEAYLAGIVIPAPRRAWINRLIEVLVAGLFPAVYGVVGVSWAGALLALLAMGLVMVSIIDLEIGIIPDVALLVLAPAGLVYGYVGGPGGINGLALSLIGGLFAGGVAFGVRYGFLRLRGRDALGLGDVKFFAMAGFWLGPFGLPSFMILSGAMGILFALLWRGLGGSREFPFGPSLALGLFLCLLFPALTRIMG